MSDNGKLSVQKTARKADPREVRDPIKRAQIPALLKLGCSRRMAAKQVGCAASTITRTADRDERFHDQLAEAQADVRALRLIRHAADQEKYWRVAAWLLERRNPDEYGRRAPFTFTGRQVTALLERAFAGIAADLPKKKLEQIAETFDDLIADVAEEARLPVPEKLELPMDEEASCDEVEQEVAAVPRIENVRAAGSAISAVGISRGGSEKSPTECPVAPPRRTSCLEQFVVRKPKSELQTVGS